MTKREFEQPDSKQHPDGVHRDRWDRPLIIIPGKPHKAKCNLCDHQVEGHPFTRATRFIDVLDDKGGLEKWKMRNVTRGLALRGDLVLQAASKINDDGVIDSVVEDAMEAAGASAAARSGTALHALTESVDRGEDAVIPPEVEGDIKAYRELVAREQWTIEEQEVTVVIDGIQPTVTARGVSGRFDRIYGLPEPCPWCGSRRRIADIKTGRVDYGGLKFPLQLATYALGKRYNYVTGDREELNVCQCWGIVVHIPARAGEAHALYANLAEAREGLSLAYDVWRWRQRDGLLLPDPPYPAPDIPALIRMARDRAGIAALYEQFTSTGDWTEEHTQIAQANLAALEAAK